MDILPIEITLASIFSEVDSRTYYQGEALKRKDADFVSIQTSADDHDALRTFIETALNNTSGRLIKRVKEFEWVIDDESITMHMIPYNRIPPHADKVIKLLKKAIFDYLVSYSIYEWLLVVKPELASVSESRNEPLLWDVVKFIGMISGNLRRRATDLAGI